MMMGDSASEPNIIANDSGLCVFMFARGRIMLHKVKVCSFELPQIQLTDRKLQLI